MSDLRPSGDVVAPVAGDVRVLDGDILALNGEEVGPCDDDDTKTYFCADGAGWLFIDTDLVVRALHESGHLDAYRDRCLAEVVDGYNTLVQQLAAQIESLQEAAAWKPYDPDDRDTWPQRPKVEPEAPRYAVRRGSQRAHCIAAWHGDYWVVNCRQAFDVTHYWPMPKPPEVKP